jgi:RNA polymerase sigma-70 factor (family 1)
MAKTLVNSDIIIDFSQGDKDAFAFVYQHYERVVFKNISKIILQQDVAEDILQEVFFKLWEHRNKFKDEQAVAAWLFTVSYNQSISHIRKLIKEREFQSAYLLKAEHTVSAEMEELDDLKAELLTDAINKLPARKKQVFELCKLQGKTYSEAAAIMGITPDTVKEHMMVALKQVKSYVLSNYPTESIASVALVTLYLQ